MPGIKLTGKVLKWGNSYGIRVSKADFERAGLHAGDVVHLDLAPRSKKVDLSDLPAFNWGGGGALGHDKILDEERAAKLRRRS